MITTEEQEKKLIHIKLKKEFFGNQNKFYELSDKESIFLNVARKVKAFGN